MDELFAKDGYMDRLRAREMLRYFVVTRTYNDWNAVPDECKDAYSSAYEAGYRQGRTDGRCDAQLALINAMKWLDDHA